MTSSRRGPGELAEDITGQHRDGGARWPWEGTMDTAEYQLAVWCERPRNADHLEKGVNYFTSGPLAMGGEGSMFTPRPWTAGQLFIFDLDQTKSQRDDPAWVLTDEETGLEAFLHSGSPVRKTDRQGPGTRGTQAFMGIAGRVLPAWR